MKKLSIAGNKIIGSEIIKISQQIKGISSSKKVSNLTIGDFNSIIWPIPASLRDHIIDCYEENLTSYPNSQGELPLREAVATHIEKRFDVQCSPEEILIGGGVRPLIYTVYKATVNPGEGVIYPTPSWNNNHYCFLHQAEKQEIPCLPENSFFPTVDEIRQKLQDPESSETSLICICSPQNPTGRVIDPSVLKGICDLIINENREREKRDLRPVYLFFDQIYSDLTIEGKFVHPLKLSPDIRPYLICADGISKSLNATGVRVGWLFGPSDVIGKMTEILSHIGAWAPKAEQNAVERFIRINHDQYLDHISDVVSAYQKIIDGICTKIEQMKERGYSVDCQRPEGGIYISIYLGYVHYFGSTEDYISYLINECGLGIVPFEYFGANHSKGWFRISIGNIAESNLDYVIESIETAIQKSSSYSNSQIF